MELSYILNELGEEMQDAYRWVAPPIVQTSNFSFAKVDDLRNAFADEYSTYLYSRGLNPTVDILRKKLAALDGAEDALVFNSGAAAIFAAVLANVKAGDQILSVKKPYTWAEKMFTVILPRFGVTTQFIDASDPSNVEAALQPNTRLIYLESPNSWTYELQDLSAIAAIAASRGIITIVDNSYCTPLYQQPIRMGIDISLQSATKYIGGHSDVVAGVISGTREMMQRIFNSEYLNIGSGISPFNAWLLLRGLRTLPLRVEQAAQTSRIIAGYLRQHPQVESVIFPFDPDFRQYELACRQMKGGGGLLTFILKANNIQEIETFCESLQHIRMAVSWGGHESLIIPRCAGIRRTHFNAAMPEHRMLRLYTGLEAPAFLQADLEQAFEKAFQNQK